MAHFAHINNQGIVDQVIVIEPDVLQKADGWIVGGVHRPFAEWIQTSYNTRHGVHELGGTPLRKNYASIGHIYDRRRDAFYAPSPFPSWKLNEQTCNWEAPIPRPSHMHQWDEKNQAWLDPK